MIGRAQNLLSALLNSVAGVEREWQMARREEAITEHLELVDAIGASIDAWRAEAKHIEALRALASQIQGQRRKIADRSTEIQFLDQILGSETPDLPDATHLRGDEIAAIRRLLDGAFTTECDSAYMGIFFEKLRDLQRERKARIKASPCVAS